MSRHRVISADLNAFFSGERRVFNVKPSWWWCYFTRGPKRTIALRQVFCNHGIFLDFIHKNASFVLNSTNISRLTLGPRTKGKEKRHGDNCSILLDSAIFMHCTIPIYVIMLRHNRSIRSCCPKCFDVTNAFKSVDCKAFPAIPWADIWYSS